MRIIEIDSLDHPGAQTFARLTDAQLAAGYAQGQSLIIVESPKVIAAAMSRGHVPAAMLCERRHIEGDAAEILRQCPEDMPLYTGPRDVLAGLTGYTLTRGVLAAFPTPRLLTLEEATCGASRVAVIDSVVDSTNVGAIFRSAAALGIDAVVVTGATCSPLSRRASRVSMGSVFLVPWTRTQSPADLQSLGFKTVAMALTDRSISIDDPALDAEPRLALILGNEGDGLPLATIAKADYTVRIPMHHGVDSLNVAAAAAVAFWQLRRKE